MLKYSIDKQNGHVFILMAKIVKESEGVYKLWYRENKFWHKWQFIGVAEGVNTIKQTIQYHFGFMAIVKQIA